MHKIAGLFVLSVAISVTAMGITEGERDSLITELNGARYACLSSLFSALPKEFSTDYLVRKAQVAEWKNEFVLRQYDDAAKTFDKGGDAGRNAIERFKDSCAGFQAKKAAEIKETLRNKPGFLKNLTTY